MTAELKLSEAAARKFSGLLGLASKAGRLSSGEFSCINSIRGGKARLCILASDSSENTKKQFSDACSYRKVRIILSGSDKAELGRMIGKKDRAVITVDDEGFSEAAVKIIEGDMAYGERER